MNKEQYWNTLGNQVHSLPDMIEAQVASSLDQAKLEQLLSADDCAAIRHVIITGCGDSLAVGGAMQPVVEKYAAVAGCDVYNPIDFTRFTSAAEITRGVEGGTMVLSISAGGETARIVEVLQKAAAIKAFPLVLTGKAESSCARAAKRSFIIETPKMKNDFPGLRSYVANMTGIIGVAARLGMARGTLSAADFDQLKSQIISYMKSYAPLLQKMDDAMFTLAQKWQAFERFDFIGDGQSLYSALFSQEKFYECTGSLGCYNDSEDWCHINYFFKNPQTIGTVFYAYPDQASFSRQLETIQAAHKIGRPILVITDSELNLAKDITVVQLPKTAPGFEWLRALADYSPAAILAGYTSMLGGKKFFNTFDTVTWTADPASVYFDPKNMTLKNSKIVFMS